jgi:hypothetical protein
VLLKQGHEEVDGQMHVLHQLILIHVHIADSNVKAQHLKKQRA